MQSCQVSLPTIVVNIVTAYEWLAVQMKLPVQLTHMVLFNVDQCRQVVEICKAHPLYAELAAADFEDLDK